MERLQSVCTHTFSLISLVLCRLFKNFLIFVEANKKMEKGVDGLNDYEGSGLIASDGDNVDGGNKTKMKSCKL